jgi:hypothetical protein
VEERHAVSVKRAARVLLKIGLALASLVALFWWGCTEPLDMTLRQTFQRNRGNFQTLIRMSDEDSIMARIDFDWMVPKSPRLTQERWNAYRELFKKLHIDRGLIRTSSGNVYLLAYTEGMFNRGMSKGYIYCRSQPRDTQWDYEPCIERSDSGYGEHYDYSRIGDGWYIYSQEDLPIKQRSGQ